MGTVGGGGSAGTVAFLLAFACLVDRPAQQQAAGEHRGDGCGEQAEAGLHPQPAAHVHRGEANERDAQDEADEGHPAGVAQALGRRHRVTRKDDGAHHTFSTSGRPSRPEGRSISTRHRMPKVATSLYSAHR